MVSRLPEGEVVEDAASGPRRRSIYLAKLRLRPLTLVEQFDGPEMTPNCLERTQSTVPTQALQLYNGNFVRQCAASLARDVMAEADRRTEDRVVDVYFRTLSRPPDVAEVELASDYLAKLEKSWRAKLPSEQAGDADLRAWETYCHALLNSPEFLFVD